MSTFYKPLTTTIASIPLIIYPMMGLENVSTLQKTNQVLEDHLLQLYQLQTDLSKGAFHILILWENAGSIMTDVWQYLQLESEDTGYTVDCKTYQGMKPTHGGGITASDGLIMLGRESELSEKMRLAGKSVAEYLTAERPSLPGELQPEVKWGE